ncbi:MAG: hypothetical protein C0503_04650 [Gemmatimonas sp.]|nr:hypothetical protein [Gemmatimonas sp.]
MAEEARMSRPDEGLIHQWLDGECTPEESARLEQLVATDPAWAAAVAEARGLMAASSRIVGALDAVPRAMPAGAQAAPALRRAPSALPRRRAVPRWLGLAAGLVLVAGTAYVLRDQATGPFGPAATPVAESMPSTPSGGDTTAAFDPRSIVPPLTVPPVGAVRTADRVLGDAERAAGATQAAPSVEEPFVPQPAPAPPVVVPRAEADAEMRRAPARQAATAVPAAPMMAAPRAQPTLEGCWRVSAPPELVGVLVAPTIRRAAGDTLVLVTTQGEVTVTRIGDELRGGLVAVLVPCGQRD